MAVLKRFFNKRSIIIASVLLIGILAWRFIASRREDKVEATEIKRGTVSEELVLSGAIDADNHANLSFLSSGELDYIGVTEGQYVTKGQVLAKLDTVSLSQMLQQAGADLRRYDASLDKTYDDVQGHKKDESFAQREERTIAETNRDKAYRAYVVAQKNLSNAILKAPFDGIVTSVKHPYADVSTLFSEAQIELIDPKTVYFNVSADQSEVTNLRTGQKVRIVLDSYPEDSYEGEVVYISYTPKTDEAGTAYKVKVNFISAVDVEKIRLGMSGDAKFVLTEKTDVLYVPPKYVKSDSGGKYVNLGRKNNKVYVDVGVEGENSVEIKGDVSEGQTVFD